jgi:KDO2-lipid IV(A) lauroyltransferase
VLGGAEDAWPLGSLGRRLRTDAVFWRRALWAGVQHGPDFWVRYSPSLFGWAFCAALGRTRARVRRSLRLALGPRPAAEELRDVAEVFRNFACAMTDGMLLSAGRGYHATARPVGEWHLVSALARGRGVILATASTAGWDVGGAILAQSSGREVVVVMEAERDAAARALHDAARARTGVRVVHAGDPLASLALLETLRSRRGIVAMKLDRVGGAMRGRTVRLFGEPFRAPEGLFALAAASGAPIVPVFTARLGFMSYLVHLRPPIHLAPRPSATAIDRVAQALADELAVFVRAYPTQWLRFAER